ncbi:hypothetical protein MO867_16740 [Microbulbifer sp. OS29]|uniref:Uncharacterized protein n=1 Tax=Microbulbifer okhotskensis TaxID=2926617 RepID=A0A9X2EQJ0_9GAMM|nr:hypothetical protein [Microbulbifer okhotskensis]MCO1335979.1 hypothetical protein [Microbulbifer okhotskensis]
MKDQGRVAEGGQQKLTQSINQLMYWKDWVRTNFVGTLPARETVVKWVESGDVAGRWLGDRLYIYRDTFHDPGTIRSQENIPARNEPLSPLLMTR